MIKPIFKIFLQQYGSKNVAYVTENIGIPFFQVKLFLGAIGGELSAELPFVLMHPKPNMKKILKADTLAEVEGFQVRCDQRLVLYQLEPVTNDLHMRPLNYFTITIYPNLNSFFVMVFFQASLDDPEYDPSEGMEMSKLGLKDKNV